MDALDTVFSEEVEPIDDAIPGLDAHFSKVGPSVTPSHVAGLDLGSILFASIRYGHATQGFADFADDVTGLVIVRQAEPGERWDGHEIAPGHVVAYGPAARHTSFSRAGVEVGLLVGLQEALRESSDVLGRSFGQTARLELKPEEAALWVDLYDELVAGPTTPDHDGAEAKILDMLVRSLSASPRHDRRETRSDLTDHRIVSRVLGYLEAAGRWTAPMLRLCEVTGMSERRIEAAFLATFGTPPSIYLRNRALSAARTQLATANEGMCTVTQVAVDHDFYHLGRFSQYYDATYGESPSATLRSPVR